MNQKLGVVMLSSFMLAACGGGGGSSATPAPAPAPTPSQSFTPQSPKSGDTYTFSETDLVSDGTTQNSTYVQQVALISSTGNFFLNVFDTTSGNQLGSELYGKDLSLISRGLCIYTPPRNDMPYPWFVGGTSSQTSTYTCPSSSTPVTLKVNTQILSYESITVPAGTFNTVKSQKTTTGTVTVSGTTGTETETDTCWTDVISGQNVKCTGTLSYSPAQTGSYLTGYSTQLTGISNLSNAPLLITANDGTGSPIPFVYYTNHENGAMSASASTATTFTLNANASVIWNINGGGSVMSNFTGTNTLNVNGIPITVFANQNSLQVKTTAGTLTAPTTVTLTAILRSDTTKMVTFNLALQ